MEKADIGVYGLGVMGRSLALNIEEHDFTVAVFNRIVPGEEEGVVEAFLENEGTGGNFIGCQSEKEFAEALQKPRKILLMLKAGPAVDKVIQQLSPLLEDGDILIDGGNSHFRDTNRRVETLEKQHIRYVGMGVSGGEEGARHGPSLMPGGSPDAWSDISDMFNMIAAKDERGKPCCNWIGPQGAGHFVKMVHNGIEYADMQLIAECYHLMKSGLEMPAEDIAHVFEEWNEGRLSSFLLEITSNILRIKDDDGSPLIDKILDTAGQKGTGRWTAIAALESGTPLPMITSAVNERMVSSLKSLRKDLSTALAAPKINISREKVAILDDLKQALLAGRVITLAEGFFLIRQVSDEYTWDINQAEITRIWQNGCIIRSKLLKTVQSVFADHLELDHLLQAKPIGKIVEENQPGLREIVSWCAKNGVPCPATGNALAQLDSLRSGWLPANLIQAQRDYFGAHKYERIDQPRGTFFHTDWKLKSENIKS